MLAALLLSGCAVPSGATSSVESAVSTAPLSSLETLSNPRSYLGESTAALQQKSVRPVAENPTPGSRSP